jgi:hypothetical protein
MSKTSQLITRLRSTVGLLNEYGDLTNEAKRRKKNPNLKLWCEQSLKHLVESIGISCSIKGFGLCDEHTSAENRQRKGEQNIGCIRRWFHVFDLRVLQVSRQPAESISVSYLLDDRAHVYLEGADVAFLGDLRVLSGGQIADA